MFEITLANVHGFVHLMIHLTRKYLFGKLSNFHFIFLLILIKKNFINVALRRVINHSETL